MESKVKFNTQDIRTISTYSLVGILTAIGYLMLYVILVEVFAIDPVIAAVTGYLPAIFVSYVLCYKWVFRSNLNHWKTSSKFFLVNGMGYLINSLGVYITVDLFEWWYIYGQTLTFCIVALHNYLINYYWTFSAQNN